MSYSLLKLNYIFSKLFLSLLLCGTLFYSHVFSQTNGIDDWNNSFIRIFYSGYLQGYIEPCG